MNYFLRMILLTMGCLFATSVVADDFPTIFNSESENHLSPMTAEEAVAKMQLPPGFKATVYASEPEVQNPIAMSWDHRGRLWIAENYTYADQTLHFDLSLRDRVLIFKDHDGDGRSDERKVFTDQVQMLTGLELGRGGVWLMCPPRLLFIPDADGDDVPDGPAQTKLDGFQVAQESYHNFANGLKWGPDGWLYGRCGHSCPGRIGPPGTPDNLRVPLDGGIWRFHPEKNVYESLCHGTVNPWGHDWDSNGELFFINTVIGHIWHCLPGSHFKESFGESLNPSVYERMDTIADHYHYDTTGTWADSRDGNANDLGGGHAHIGAIIYQGTTWPESYRGKLFTVNMHGLRVNTERIERHGAGFVGRHEPDFMIAGDPFFRALDLSMGPDGNVAIIDWSDVGECHERNGIHRTSGRIYSVRYGDQGQPHQLAKPLCLLGAGDLPKLWADYQAGQASVSELRKLLNHENEHVRIWAIRLLTDFCSLDTILGPRKDAQYPIEPKTIDDFIRMAKDDKSSLVHLVLASTIQRLPLEARPRLAKALIEHDAYANDRDLPLLVWYGLIPVADSQPQSLVELARSCRWPKLTKWIARYLGSRPEVLAEQLDGILRIAIDESAEYQSAVLHGLREGLDGWRKAPAPSSWARFAALSGLQKESETLQDISGVFGDGRALSDLRRVVADGKADMKIRQRALETLIDLRAENLRELCESLLNERVLNGTALRGLTLFDDPAIASKIAKSYKRFLPEDRPRAMEALVSRPAFADALLDEIQQRKGGIRREELSAFHARQIRSLNDERLTKKLAEVWGEIRDGADEKKQAIAAAKADLSSEGLAHADLAQGRTLFNKNCSQCHRLYGFGQSIGPDLTGAQRSNLDYLLESIMDPSAIVGKDYRMTLIRTVDGRTLSGLVVSRDKKTLVMQTPIARETILIDDIEEEKATTLSSMPDGLLDNLSPKHKVDLIGYLMHSSQVAPAE